MKLLLHFGAVSIFALLSACGGSDLIQYFWTPR